MGPSKIGFWIYKGVVLGTSVGRSDCATFAMYTQSRHLLRHYVSQKVYCATWCVKIKRDFPITTGKSLDINDWQKDVF